MAGGKPETDGSASLSKISSNFSLNPSVEIAAMVSGPAAGRPTRTDYEDESNSGHDAEHAPREAGLHVDRTPGGDRHHRHPGRHAASGLGQGPRDRQADFLRQ